MVWMPDALQTHLSLKRLEQANDDLVYSPLFFFLFSENCLSPERFKERLEKHLRHCQEARERGTLGFLDPDIEPLIMQGADNSEKVAQMLAARLDRLAEKKKALCIQYNNLDTSSLFVFVHIEAARLARIINEDNIDGIKEILSSAAESFLICENLIRSSKEEQWPKYLLASLKAVGSFLFSTKFSLQKLNCQYEEALKSFLKAVDLVQQSQLLSSQDGYPCISKSKLGPSGEIPERESNIYYLKMAVRNIVQAPPAHSFLSYSFSSSAPWVQPLNPQNSSDCFEALRQGGRIIDSKSLALACHRFIELSRDNTFGIWDEKQLIEDSNDCKWEPTIYWYNALGWVEGRLNSSELIELMQQSEDNIAEKRLLTYFFDYQTWERLPDRVKQSLINADRLWSCGEKARKEALLEEIKIAVEELLLQNLWVLLNQWILNSDQRRRAGLDFTNLEAGLSRANHAPSLRDYEKMLGFSITEEYLKQRSIFPGEREWLIKELPVFLRKLRIKRDKGEHDSTKWSKQDLAIFFNSFFGIGQPGIFQRLTASLLYKPMQRDRRTSF
jgi:hypothetical protein